MSRFLLGVLLIAGINHTALADSKTDCLDQKSLAALEFYNLEPWFGLNKPVGSESSLNFCDPTSLERKTLDALVFMEDLTPREAKTDEFDQGFMGASPADFFKQRIRTILFDAEDILSCGPSTIAYYNGGPAADSIHICAYASNYSTMQMASTLVHEARHSEGYPHSFCENGYMLRMLACDDSYADGGSYGIGVEFAVKVSRNESVSPVLRQEARGNAAADLLNRFNQFPLGTKMGLPLVAEDNSLDFFDGDTVQLMSARPQHDNILWAQRDVPVQYDLVKGEISRQIPGFEPTFGAGFFAKVFTDMPLEKRMQLLDVHYGDIACLLFETTIFCDYQGMRAEVPIPEGMHAERFLELNTTISDIFYIRTKEGTHFAVNVGTDPAKWKPEDFMKGDNYLWNYLGFAAIGNTKRYSISPEGMLQIQSQVKNPPWLPVKATEGRKYKNILRPMLWSDKLKDL